MITLYSFVGAAHVDADADLRRSAGFNGVTIGDTHGVGPSARSMMFCSSNSFSSSTFLHKQNGTRQWFCADSPMFLWMCRQPDVLVDVRTWKFLSLPSPLNSSRCCIESALLDIIYIIYIYTLYIYIYIYIGYYPIVLMLILIDPRSHVVLKLSNEPPSPRRTKISASADLPFAFDGGAKCFDDVHRRIRSVSIWFGARPHQCWTGFQL